MPIIIIILVFYFWFMYFSPFSTKEINKRKAEMRAEITKEKELKEREKAEELKKEELKAQRENLNKNINDNLFYIQSKLKEIKSLKPNFEYEKHLHEYEEFKDVMMYTFGSDNPKFYSKEVPIENLEKINSVFDNIYFIYLYITYFITKQNDVDSVKLKNKCCRHVLLFIDEYKIHSVDYKNFLEKEAECVNGVNLV